MMNTKGIFYGFPDDEPDAEKDVIKSGNKPSGGK
ncbi:MAG: hypothetical protein ACI9N9_001091 [Enterobacterales bacterium]|jgi:hypothetical protein